MAGRLLAVAAALSALIACPAMSQGRPGLAPSGAWTLDYDDDSCALRRMFGAGENRAYVEFRRFGPDFWLQAVVASERMTARNPARFRYRFGDEAEWRDANGINITLDNGFSGVIFNPQLAYNPEGIEDLQAYYAYLRSIDRKAVESEAGAGIDTITLRGAYRRELRLQLGKLDAPIAALNECVDELMTHWDIDIEAHKTLTRAAIPIDFTDSSSMLGYPPKMLQRSMPGLVHIRLAIGETGRITGCHIQMPLSDPEFEASSCADIQHAFEFEPALDKDGKPIASYWLTRVRFQLGGF